MALYSNKANLTLINIYSPLFFYFFEFLWSAIPGIVHGSIEEDVPSEIALRLPTLYTLVSISNSTNSHNLP